MFDFDVITGPGPIDRRREEKPPVSAAAKPAVMHWTSTGQRLSSVTPLKRTSTIALVVRTPAVSPTRNANCCWGLTKKSALGSWVPVFDEHANRITTRPRGMTWCRLSRMERLPSWMLVRIHDPRKRSGHMRAWHGGCTIDEHQLGTLPNW